MFTRKLTLLFAILSLCVGLVCFRDYGISTDEPINRVNGIVSMQYVGEKLGFLQPSKEIPKLHSYIDKDYGVVFDIPLLIIEKALKLNSDDKSQSLYFMRHLCTFLMFWVATIFFFLTAFKIFQNQAIALIGTSFLILSPRIFAESFYNSKDVVCLSFFIITSFFVIRFIERYDFKSALWLAIFTAISINVRLTGVIFIAVAVGWASIDFVGTFQPRRKLFIALLTYLSFVALLTVALWPYLWENPIGNFKQAFEAMQKFRADGTSLFLGDWISIPQLPRYYAIVYFMLTTPIAYLVLGVTGILVIVFQQLRQISTFLSQGIYQKETRYQLTYLALFAGPLVVIAYLHSVLYDGWRQVYFIYGAFMILVLYGLDFILRFLDGKTVERFLLIIILSICVAHTSYWMWRNHPHQNVYFNELAPKPIYKNFDVDYWGLSYRQALEYILAHDTRPKIKVITNHSAGTHNVMILDPKSRERLLGSYIKPEVRDTTSTADLKCDYFITEFRFHDDPSPYYKEIFSINVDNSHIITIYDGHYLRPERVRVTK